MLVAALTFAVTMLIALFPKSPTEPPDLPETLKRIAGEIGGKYWWALTIGGVVAIWLDRRVLWRLVLTLLVSQIAIETLKFTVGEVRPDGRFFNSFPSGHTTSAFAYATIMSMHFRWGWIWFPFAIIVGLSRIVSHAHWWHDVVGGAALGYIIAFGMHKLLCYLQPKISPSTPSSGPEQPEHLGSFERLTIQETQNAGQGE
ncbi:MAG: phosphatase PAP2 family protein [Armatimonadetes bacterium]|nr:phosphatase PAP2 family protein [Armatimonadota bacterium]